MAIPSMEDIIRGQRVHGNRDGCAPSQRRNIGAPARGKGVVSLV